MRLRNLKNKDAIMNQSKVLIRNPKDFCGKWQTVFGNNHPIYVEIGTGKGKFIVEMAEAFPDINFIGIERYDSVIARALEKVDYPSNLRFIRMDALEIDMVFQNEVSRIFLNFSDPWPKVRHHNRRLTSPVFLEKYDKIFKDTCEIYQKTDNRDLFSYSIESLSQYGYVFSKVSLDLENEKEVDNIKTEYETRFTELGLPIYYLAAFKKK